jgi:hypothetical protein
MGSNAVCVLGMHRSGTSVITRAVNLLGFYVGEQEELLPPREDNLEGFWEYIGFVYLNERVLEAFGLSWDTTKRLPDGWTTSPSIRQYREKLKEIIYNNFKHKEFWAWKDPRTCLLLPLWKEILEELQIDLSFVVAFRNPLDVMSSLKKRDGLSQEIAELIWYNYTVSCLHDLLDLPNSKKIFIQYDHFLEEPLNCMQEIQGKLGLGSLVSLTDQDVNSFIRSDLRHSYSTIKDLEQNRDISQDTIELYRLCLSGLGNSDFLEQDEYIQKIKALYAKLIESSYQHDSTFSEMQVFWRSSEEKYTEQKSLKNAIQGDNLFHKYQFTIPGNIAFPIRIDPTNVCSFFEISSIYLSGITANSEQFVLYNSSEEGFKNLLLENGVLLNSTEAFAGIASEDPQIFFEVSTTSAIYEQYNLVVEMWAGFELNPYTTELISKAYRVSNEERTSLLETLKKRQEEVSFKQEELNDALHSNFLYQEEKLGLNMQLLSYKKQNEELSNNNEELLNQNEKLLNQIKKISQILNEEKSITTVLRQELDLKNNVIEIQNIDMAEILNSRSWKITSPLRNFGALIRKKK